MSDFIKDLSNLWNKLPNELKSNVKDKIPVEVQAVGALVNNLLNPSDSNDNTGTEKEFEKNSDEDIIDVEWEEI